MELTQLQREALIAAGGCVHTPNPFSACDTCSRPAMGGSASAVVAYGFVAQTVDGGIITQADSPSVSHLPLDVVRRLIVVTDDPRIPRVTLEVDPDKGERLFRFRRVAHRMASSNGQAIQHTGQLVVEVLEVRNADGWAVRLYLHPLQGPILSTKDLYF